MMDVRFRNFLGNLRNLVYYYSIDTSERSTYFHIVRRYRSRAVELLNAKVGDASFLSDIINSISPKIDKEECEVWISETLPSIISKHEDLYQKKD